MNAEFIPRNAGAANDLFSLELRLRRRIAIAEGIHVEPIAEAFNALNRGNNLTRNGVFGTGVYPTNPSASFSQVTAVHDARSMQFALRIQF